MVAPIEQPIATFFFSGVPSMGCQCGDLGEVRIRAAVRSVMVISVIDGWISDGRCCCYQQLTVNSRTVGEKW